MPVAEGGASDYPVAVDNNLPLVYLARHGETDWSLTGQHTGLSDIPLTERGQRNAARLGRRLEKIAFAEVFASPLQRALHTAQLAGYATRAQIDPDLVEWNYGQYEGLRTADIHTGNPGWDLFRDGAPGGESVADVAARADRVIARLRAVAGNVLLFSSGHFLRVLGARWIALEAAAGRALMLDTAALSIVGYEHTRDHPAIRLWNDTRHVDE
jgi:probable phosphoglycerate mutase